MTTPPSRSAYDLGFLGYPEQPTRRVFFSFHHKEPDLWRAYIVRNSNVVKRHNGEPGGYADNSLWEEAKTEGKARLKRFIDQGLSGCSVTCVLIGKNTFARPWVQYEIFKSIGDGKGVFGVFLDGLGDREGRTDIRGKNPFDYLGYDVSDSDPGKLVPCVNFSTRRKFYRDADPISANDARFWSFTSNMLSVQLKVYDWVGDDGYNWFPIWVQAAAQQVQR